MSQKTHHSINAIIIVQPEIMRHLGSMGIELVLAWEPRLVLGSSMVQPTVLAEIPQA